MSIQINMTSILNSFILLLVLFIFEFLYFKFADHFNIIDKPNTRSSHSTITLRGGGIIFCIACLMFYLFFGFKYHFFIIGLLAISIISFLDDILTLNNKIRISIHLFSVVFLFYQWDLYNLQWYWLILVGIFVIGTINAYNFMDGINGMTGGYSLLTIISLFYINSEVLQFTTNDLLIVVGLSLLVFNYFNFRTSAKCFAGDVGSVSIAFIILFLIGQLILKSENFIYILLLFIYGLDTATTVLFRKIRRENIFKAHRGHFYQYLANQLKYNHLLVSMFYIIIQLFINCVIIFVVKNSIVFAMVFSSIFTALFFIIRFLVEGKKYLLESHF